MTFSGKKNLGPAIIIILHIVGAIGLSWDVSRPYILPLTPVNLLLSTYLLFVHHSGSKTQFMIGFFSCAAIGLVVEIMGVQTGFPFGNYQYGEPLGWKIFDTPWLIGLNWFLLSYVVYSWLSGFIQNTYLKIVIGAAALTCIDILIEPVAIELNYWSWQSASIPLQNYISWFFVALIMQSGLTMMIKNPTNKLAPVILFSQIGFFLFIFFTKNLNSL